jgi:2',3'-cyclic-nucleotide 2'-phosphodiesterase
MRAPIAAPSRVFAYIWAVNEIRLLFLGDIVGKPGRELVRRALPSLLEHYNIDLVIANAENIAAGRGITRELGDQLLNWGVDVITTGNHIWSQREAIDYIGAEARLLRPANFPAGVPGNGSYLARTAQGRPVGVINVMGRVFMQELDNPFQRVLEEIDTLRPRTRIIFVDFHAEATSEKIAMGWHLDGKVTAVIGTHTHVQTADEQILPGGTAYLTDVGMTGPHDGVIGVEKAPVIDKFLRGMPVRMETATGNPRLNGIVIAADETTGKALSIQRLSLSAKELEHELAV